MDSKRQAQMQEALLRPVMWTCGLCQQRFMTYGEWVELPNGKRAIVEVKDHICNVA